MNGLIRRLLIACVLVATLLSAAPSRADIIAFDTPATAVQQVNLFNIPATLTAHGQIQWSLDVDASGNTFPGHTSSLAASFQGVLPAAFAPLGVAGAPFLLFANSPQVINVTNNGTHVSVDTTFGLQVFGPGGIVLANFHTLAPSNFSASVDGLPFGAGVVFQSPSRPNDLTSIFIGDNLLGIPSGTPVGVSFDRTVTTTPEPSSLIALLGVAVIGLGGRSLRRGRG